MAAPRSPSDIPGMGMGTRLVMRSLIDTNPYLRDPLKRRAMFAASVQTSTRIERVELTIEDLLK